MEIEFDNFVKYKDIESCLVYNSTISDVKPLISIAIPTYRRPSLLRDSIESAVNQTLISSIEILIVDNDESSEFSDQIVDIVSEFNGVSIKYYRNSENIGMFGNWNRCFELSSSDYVVILNDDDLLHPEFARYALENINNASMLVTSHTQFNERSDVNFVATECRLNSQPKKVSLGDILCKNLANGSLGVLFNRKVAIDLGGFPESAFPISDYSFLVKNYMHGKLMVSDANLSYYRWGSNESMKAEVLDGFIVKGYALCNNLINESKRGVVVRKISIFLIKIIYSDTSLQYKNINDKYLPFASIAKVTNRTERIIVVFSTRNRFFAALSKRVLKFIWRRY